MSREGVRCFGVLPKWLLGICLSVACLYAYYHNPLSVKALVISAHGVTLTSFCNYNDFGFWIFLNEITNAEEAKCNVK